MEEFKIDSFKVNHFTLKPGVHISRTDNVGGDVITTYDIRMKRPNGGEYLSPAASHTIEHYLATYLRKNTEGVIYFGPMGCLTGFYLVKAGNPSVDEVSSDIIKALDYMLADDDMPGSSSHECGNYLMHDLISARTEATKFKCILDKEGARE